MTELDTRNEESKKKTACYSSHHDSCVSNISSVRRKCLILGVNNGLFNDADMPRPWYKSFTPTWHVIGLCQQPFCVQVTSGDTPTGRVFSQNVAAAI